MPARKQSAEQQPAGRLSLPETDDERRQALRGLFIRFMARDNLDEMAKQLDKDNEAAIKDAQRLQEGIKI